MTSIFDTDRRGFLVGGSLAVMLASPTHGAGKTTGLLASSAHPLSADDLPKGFAAPPHGAKPHTWWHWMDGNVTREGITADLEAMQRIGLGGVQIFNVSYQIPFGKVPYMSPEWLQMIRHTAMECARLGLEMGMHNCTGWSSSGGPWVTPDMGMKKVVWSETRVGAGTFRGTLPKPDCGRFGDYYRDIAILACKHPPRESAALASRGAKISTNHAKWPATPPPVWPGAEPPFPVSSDPVQDYAVLADHLDITLPGPSMAAAQYIQIETKDAFTANALLFDYATKSVGTVCAVQVSEDGNDFRTVATARLEDRGQPSITFPSVASRYFRILFTATGDAAPVRVQAVNLIGGYRLPQWRAKAGFAPLHAWQPAWDETPPSDMLFKGSDIIDLTHIVQPDGTLDWLAPPGDWTILRFGYAPNGQGSAHPEVPAGMGLEIDKLDKAALELHFDHMTKVVAKAMGAWAGKAFTNLLIDSYEVGPQNWTKGFDQEFRRRNGYDLIPYLPLLTGRVIDSVEDAERVLWDLRKVIADLFAENYFGHFRTLCHQHGLIAAIEPYGGPFSMMDGAKAADLPMSEFWTGNGDGKTQARTRMVASAAHISGQAVVGAEAFTSSATADPYTLAPCDLKALGDFQFCDGINRFIFHRYALQPWLDKAPGMTMGPWGLHFDRTQTWWNQSAAYIHYLTRSQFLLQAGVAVADVLAFAGEDSQSAPQWGGEPVPQMPEGHDYEFIGLKDLAAASIQDGAIVLGNGRPYRMLVLPDVPYMTLDLLRVIARLVEQGGAVLAPRPKRNPHFASAAYASEFAATVTRLWGEGDAKDAGWRACGAGAMHWHMTIEAVLKRYGVKPDFDPSSSSDAQRIVFKHRILSRTHIYFVSNQGKRATKFMARFRVTGCVPQFWDAETGHIVDAPVYAERDGATDVAMSLDQEGAVFVIFAPAKHGDHAISLSAPPAAEYRLSRGGASLNLVAATPGRYDVQTAGGRALSATIARAGRVIALDDDWNVHFPSGLGAPRQAHLPRLLSLSENAEPGIRYFSGTCIYRREVVVPAEMLEGECVVILDLGMVAKLARVRVNRMDFGVLWKAPYKVDISKALKAGRNQLAIEVTNVWANRLIGDEQLPDEASWIAVPGRGWRLQDKPAWFDTSGPRSSGRIASSTWKYYSKDSPLPDSGLIGPVKLMIATRVRFT